MKKRVFGRQFKRDTNERKALFKSLLSSLVLKDRIKTTEQKAKAIKGMADKLVTKVKKRGKNATAVLGRHLTIDAIEKLITDVAPRFGKRDGGYTRIIRLGSRFNDNASMVLLEWTEKPIMNEELGIKNKEEKKSSEGEQEKKKKKTEVKKSVKPSRNLKKEKK